MSDYSPNPEIEPTIEPRIYVASLSDYNNGILHGAWLSAAREPDGLQADIAAMLDTSPMTKRYGEPAEEWAIHDYEGFGVLRLGEFEPIERITTIAAGIAEHGPAFAAFIASGIVDEDEICDQFEERYCGEWDSIEAYAEELLIDLGADAALEHLPEWLQSHVRLDFEGFGRDLVLGGDVTAVETPTGRTWVFRCF